MSFHHDNDTQQWRTDLLARESAAGHRLLEERRRFNAVLRGGGRPARRRQTSTVVVRWTLRSDLADQKVATYPAKKLKELGWKLQRSTGENRQVLRGPSATQARLVALVRSAWKGKVNKGGKLTIAKLDAKRRQRCAVCLAKYGAKGQKPPSKTSGGALWCSGKSKWNRHPAARSLTKHCRSCVQDFCVCAHVGARSGRTYGCSRCSLCVDT